MSQCRHCSKPLSFWDVLRAVNPASIPCGGCGQAILINKKSAILAATLVLMVAIAVCWYVLSLGYGTSVLVLVVVGLGVLVEMTYYLLIKRGVIKSDLD